VCSYCIASCGDLGPAHGATFFIYYVRVIAAKELQLQDKTYCNNPLAKSFFSLCFQQIYFFPNKPEKEGGLSIHSGTNQLRDFTNSSPH
jgi:hypothetical protein